MIGLDWENNLERFKTKMGLLIKANMEEKQLSWRSTSEAELTRIILKYIYRKDYTSIANIAFMLWENSLPKEKQEEVNR